MSDSFHFVASVKTEQEEEGGGGEHTAVLQLRLRHTNKKKTYR